MFFQSTKLGVSLDRNTAYGREQQAQLARVFDTSSLYQEQIQGGQHRDIMESQTGMYYGPTLGASGGLRADNIDHENFLREVRNLNERTDRQQEVHVQRQLCTPYIGRGMGDVDRENEFRFGVTTSRLPKSANRVSEQTYYYDRVSEDVQTLRGLESTYNFNGMHISPLNPRNIVASHLPYREGTVPVEPINPRHKARK
jgi:hypothetical protein